MSDPQRRAHAGSPTEFPPAQVFDWLFGGPFSKQSDFVPAAHVISRVEDERPVFVDEASGESLLHRSP